MKKMRILVVDDNTVNLAALEQNLKDTYEVIPVISGKRAIKYLCCENVDMILLDVQMPVMDGVQTLREIRNMKNGSAIPVIFLTAMKDRDTVIEGSQLGILDYITKPFNVEDLKSRIDHAFKRLGILSVGDNELIESLKGVLKDIEEENHKQAIARMDEIRGYQISDEVSGRVRNAMIKLEKGDIQPAENMIKNTIKMLESRLGINSSGRRISISDRELYARLLDIRECIKNFKTKAAIDGCRNLSRYFLPEEISKKMQHAEDKLIGYDDETARNVINDLIEQIGENME